MKEILLGEVIRQRRIDLGLTQEELCEGICAPVTMSRLENGTQTPSRNRINALLERLGLPGDRYYAIVSEREKELGRLQSKVNACCVHAQNSRKAERGKALEEAWATLAQLEQFAESDDLLAQQFILRLKATLGHLEGQYDYETERELLLKALHLTVPRFHPEKINDCLYTMDEVKIVNQIAVTYLSSQQDDIALSFCMQLMYYIQTHFQEVLHSNGLLPAVACNYTIALMHCRKYSEALKMAEQGVQSCIQYGYYQALPHLKHNMMECCHMLGDNIRSIKLCYEAFYLYSAYENQRGVELITADAKKYLNIILPV